MRLLVTTLLLAALGLSSAANALTHSHTLTADSLRHSRVVKGILPIKGETLIAICDVTHNWKVDTTGSRLSAIARYVHGRFEEIVDSNMMSESPIVSPQASNVTRFFQTHNNLDLYNSGRVAGKASIGPIYYEDGCSGWTLIAEPRADFSTKMLRSVRPSFENGDTELGYFTFLAISSPTICITREESFNAPVALEAKSLKSIANRLALKRWKFRSDSLKVERMVTLDLDSDGQPEYFAQCSTGYQDSAKQFSCLIGYHVVAGIVRPFFTELNGGARVAGDYEDYSDASFVDAVDVTGDRVPELVFQCNGYEWSWYRIYQYRKGKLTVVFNGYGSGC